MASTALADDSDDDVEELSETEFKRRTLRLVRTDVGVRTIGGRVGLCRGHGYDGFLPGLITAFTPRRGTPTGRGQQLARNCGAALLLRCLLQSDLALQSGPRGCVVSNLNWLSYSKDCKKQLTIKGHFFLIHLLKVYFG